jgi:tetratricopeptide (TPR) repeat protein
MQGQYEKSSGYFSKAIDLNKDFAFAYYYRGYAEFIMGKTAFALLDYKRANALKPDLFSFMQSLAICYAETGQHKAAIETLDRAAKLYPKNSIIFRYRSSYKAVIGDINGALEDYNMIISLDPDDANSYYYRSSLYYEIKDYTKALDDISKAIGLKTDQPSAYRKKGLYEYYLDRKDEACKDFHVASERGDTLSNTYIAKYCKK